MLLKESIERNVNVAILLISRGQKGESVEGREFRSNTLYQTRHILYFQYRVNPPGWPPSNKYYQTKKTFYSLQCQKIPSWKIDVQALLLKMVNSTLSQSVQRLQNISHNGCWHGPASVHDPTTLSHKAKPSSSGPELAPVA